MMELRIISPQEDEFVKEIQWNHEELKQGLLAATEKYRGLLLTDGDMDYGKKERAKLRKFKEAMETARKSMKNRCLDPYQKFESQMKDVMVPVDEAIALLDGQIKEYEEEKRVEKSNAIRDLYDTCIGTLRGILPFDRVLKRQWLNVSISLKSIQKELEELVARVNSDLDTIEGLGGPYDAQIRDMYIRTLDLSAALQEKARLEEQKRRLEERQAAKEAEEALRREQEEQRAAALERERQAYLEAKEREAEQRAADAPKEPPAGAPAQRSGGPAQEDSLYRVELEVYGSRGQLTAFQEFLKENNIFYRTISKAKRIN